MIDNHTWYTKLKRASNFVYYELWDSAWMAVTARHMSIHGQISILTNLYEPKYTRFNPLWLKLVCFGLCLDHMTETQQVAREQCITWVVKKHLFTVNQQRVGLWNNI